jgi:hypothetical protein
MSSHPQPLKSNLITGIKFYLYKVDNSPSDPHRLQLAKSIQKAEGGHASAQGVEMVQIVRSSPRLLYLLS